jgi:hypothetical protein
MPELPDITVYNGSLPAKLTGDRLRHIRISSPFPLRTAAPPIASVQGLAVSAVERLGKCVVVALDGGSAGTLFLVLHRMMAGWLHWHAALAEPPAKTAWVCISPATARWPWPRPASSGKVQRIVPTSNEANCCARCQTGGKLLADRAPSKLLHASRPKHIDDLD